MNFDFIFHRDVEKRRWMITRGEGIYLFDSNGKRYIDGAGGIGVVNIGHSVPEVIEAMKEQAEKICFVYNAQFITEPAAKLAEKIISLSPPGFSRVFIGSGGSEAIETAIKIARQYHLEKGKSSKYKVIARWPGYHGNTIAALSLSGRPAWRENFVPLLINFPHIPAPYCYRCYFGKNYPECGLECAFELERKIKLEGRDSVSAFISEPVIGTTAPGVSPPPEYYRIIRKICDRYDILMIVDEVITGFGRTGEKFAINHWKITPDIIVTGKGISSGYAPVSATVVHEKIWQAFAKGSGKFPHGFTYTEHPLSCATALAVQRYIEKNNLIERCAKIGSVLLEKLSALKSFSIVGDVRGKGLLIGIEFVKDKEKKTPFPSEMRVQERIVEMCFKKGLVLVPGITTNIKGMPGDQVQISPPYIIDEKIVDEMRDILEESIREVEKEIL
ncbi:aminotransferase class III-fold pyridoxal phosphate-dependent enzyme [Candidatus Aerophobetes bacterium]|nr:aminotransferase class III-fold pyridoxal phosphate-dependent enzyme [Candidatus Aerophobetes bacterium]